MCPQTASAQLTCGQIFNSSPDHEALLTRRMEEFRKQGFYEKDFCNCNVQNLLLFLANKGLDVSSFKVLFLIPNNDPHFSLFPLATRQEVPHWDLHVVLEAQGKIYDLDSNLKPSSLRSYFSAMFNATSENTADIYVRPIPATEYLLNHIDHRSMVGQKNNPASPIEVKDFYHYAYEANDFPLLPLNEFLNQF